MSETISKPSEGLGTAQKTDAMQRLMSVDALRGFDMFWIIGAGSIVYALEQVRFGSSDKANPIITFIATQLKHVSWEGFRFYDLIFPLFIFVVGVSTVFSLSKTISQVGRAAALKRVFLRSLFLYVLGIFYYGGFSNPFPGMRLVGVLNRIALCYLFGGLLFCFFKPRTLVAICAGLLVGYWAIMAFVPIRNISLEKESLAKVVKQTGISDVNTLYNQTTEKVTGHFEKGLNLANHIDFLYLPGAKAYGDHFDPEGILSTLPAIATCLLGIFAGLLLRSGEVTDERKVTCLICAGVIAIIAGWIWSFHFPVIKRIWTSSFVLVAGGYSALLLAIFYLIVDVFKWQKWCKPFVWVGTNSITIYLATNILDFNKLAHRFAGGDIEEFLNAHLFKGSGDVLTALIGLGLAIWVTRFLYRRKIFLRV